MPLRMASQPLSTDTIVAFKFARLSAVAAPKPDGSLIEYTRLVPGSFWSSCSMPV